MLKIKSQSVFSICISAYKAKFLEECIQSILNQSFQEFELIILNDCSPEPVEVIVNSFIDARIKYFVNTTNVGGENLVLNWNKCLNLATEEYIVIMGDDDLMEPNYLLEFKTLIEKFPGLDVYHCRTQIIDDDGKDIQLTAELPVFESVYDNIWHRITARRLQYISDFVYRRVSLIEKRGFYFLPLAWGSDDITSFIACGSKGIAHTNVPVFKYRRNQLSISTTGNFHQKIASYNLYMDWLSAFLLKHPVHDSDQNHYSDLVLNHTQYLSSKKFALLFKELKINTVKKAISFLVESEKLKLSKKDIIYLTLVTLRQKSGFVNPINLIKPHLVRFLKR